MRASSLVQAWKCIKLFGLAWLLMAVMIQRLCLSRVDGSLTFIACWDVCELGCSLLLWCCFEQKNMGNLELMCPGRANCFLFGGYGKHLLSFLLNLDTTGEVFLECVSFYSDFHLDGDEREFKLVRCWTPAEGYGKRY